MYENVYTVRWQLLWLVSKGLHPVSGSFCIVHHFKNWRCFYWRWETGGALAGGRNGMVWERGHQVVINRFCACMVFLGFNISLEDVIVFFI